MFSSRSFIISDLTFRSLIHFELSLCVVLGSVLISLFYMELSSFPSTFIKETVLAPLYILASFVKNKLPMGAWVYFWAFYLVPLVYICVFVPVPYCLDDCSFVVSSEVRKVDSSSSILLSQDCFGYSGSFCFHMNCDIFYSRF